MDDQTLRNEEEALRLEVAKLSPEQKKQYYSLETQRVKDPDTYAVLNYFFVTGLHHFYLGKNTQGLIDIVVLAIGILTIEYYGWILIILISLYELPQLFKSQKILHQYNNDVMKQTLNEITQPLTSEQTNV
ncbi:TM2 domain-containing protein [Algibacillus agarilyticus]|uniref:TM2 domain-containing protein n=1 Tax=Algibacillus agarilyticus TaxID=2234133 RepID=UPI000DD06B5A|nr:TM2 domain-containing protein [Algibacillus agarilyticus]